MDPSTEGPFKIAFAAFWIANFIVRVYFQAKARGSRRAFARNQHTAALGFRILAVGYLLLLLYPLTTWLDFAHVSLAAPIRWSAGVTLFALYFALFVASHIELGKHWSGLVEIHEDHTLVTSGPYRLMRHPMYTAFFLWCLVTFTLTCNWLISGIYALAVFWMVASRVSAEEEMMIERFGNAYCEYRDRTGRFVPRI